MLQTDRQTDGQADGRHAISIPCYALVHRVVKTNTQHTDWWPSCTIKKPLRTTTLHVKSCVYHALIVLNILKASLAVLMITPGNCVCQCSSLISFCPWCTNSSCDGTSSWLPAELELIGISSGSTAKSQIVSRSSAAETASTELSFGFHSSDVIGAVWYRNDTTGVNSEPPAYTYSS